MSKIVGIDLGTTYSLIAHIVGGMPQIIRDDHGSTQVASVVGIGPTGEPLVGEEAVRLASEHPDATVYSVKRFMGKAYADVEKEAALLPFAISTTSANIVRIKIGNREYTPPEISAMILKRLKSQAETALGETIEKAVITVPAYFNDAQRQATKDAGRLAGLDVLRIVNEPTAASLAYGLQSKARGVIAVYDLGGGTFDISILKITIGVFEVLSTNGNTRLGGDDMDRRIMDLIENEIEIQTGKRPNSGSAHHLIRAAAERAKRDLTDAAETMIRVTLEDPKIEYTRKFTREEFEGMISELLDVTRKHCKQAMADAGVTSEQIEDVILVGGSTRVPAVRELVKSIFKREPKCDINPDEVVALGAAVQADILAGNQRDILLLDVTPLSLGIETYGGVMSKLIERNTTIPSSASEMFTTYVDGQTNVEIHVLQGEREIAKDNRSLARFTLRGIEPMPASLPRIEVIFTIDADGILHVKAVDKRSGLAQNMDIQPTYGLTDEEVEKMLFDSIEKAGEDLEQRQLIEARNDADITIRAAQKSLERNPDLLSPEEKMRIDASLEELIAARNGEDHNLIRGAMEAFEVSAMPLTERQVNNAIRSALKDRNISEVNP